MEHTEARGRGRGGRGRGLGRRGRRGGRGGIQNRLPPSVVPPSVTATPSPSPLASHSPTSPAPSTPVQGLSPSTGHQPSPAPSRSPSVPTGHSSQGARPYLFGEGTSYTMPRGPSPPEHRIRLYPEGSGAQIGYYPSKPGTSALTKVIKLKLDKPYINWQHVPVQVRDLWWREWKKYVTWDPQHEAHMQKAFNARAARRIQDLYNKAHNRGQKPVWMSEHIWQCLCEHWRTATFIKKSDQSKKNRASETGGSMHTGGCISPGTHAARMAIELGRPPTHLEIFTRTHLRRSDGNWVDERARKTAEAFQRELLSQSQSGPEDLTNPDAEQFETEIWSRVVGGRNKKGRLYGASYQGSSRADGAPVEGTSSAPSPSTSYADREFQDFRHWVQHKIERIEDSQQSLMEKLDQLIAHAGMRPSGRPPLYPRSGPTHTPPPVVQDPSLHGASNDLLGDEDEDDEDYEDDDYYADDFPPAS